MSILERAKIAFRVSSDKDLAQALGMATTTIAGYKSRGGNIPLEHCIRISDLTGVDLNWLIKGTGISPDDSIAAAQPESIANLPISEQMLLAGFRALDEQQQAEVFQSLLKLSKKQNNQESKQFGNVGQYVTGNSNIENQTLIQKNK